jgi:hypothetical protein
MNKSRFLASFAAGLMLATLAGCGGGGGGGDGGTPLPPPPVYSGNTNAAVVTAANASKLTADVIGSGNTTGIVGGVSTQGGDATQGRGSGMVQLVQRLNRYVRDTAVRAGQVSATQRIMSAVIPIGQTDPCDGGFGSISLSGTLADDGTGTLAVNFNNCLIDGVTVNGPATLRVDAAQVTLNVFPTDSTLSFPVLTLRGTGLSIDVGGSSPEGTIRLVLSTAPFGTETLTANFDARDNTTGETGRTKNLVIVNVTTSPSSFTSNVSGGQVFDHVHGYVDITTPTLLVFNNLNLFPDSGQLLLMGAPAGAGNGTILITALDSTRVQLQLDTNGDGTVDNTARLKWTDLSGPVGADLGDTDLDGMHNSWETANGLLPDVDDAALDKDNDTVSNLNEYLAGTDPSVP